MESDLRAQENSLQPNIHTIADIGSKQDRKWLFTEKYGIKSYRHAHRQFSNNDSDSKGESLSKCFDNILRLRIANCSEIQGSAFLVQVRNVILFPKLFWLSVGKNVLVTKKNLCKVFEV